MWKVTHSLSFTVLVLASCLFAKPNATQAEIDIDPLSGINRAVVTISLNSTGKPPSGITEERLRTIVELKLRTAGLTVLDLSDYKPEVQIVPFIYLRIRTLEITMGSDSKGFASQFSLAARVFSLSPTNHAVVPADLWADGTLAIANKDDVSDQIEEITGELTDSFLNAWLKANPKK